MSKQEWAAEQAQRIGATVRRLRGDRSGLWLSNETAKAGHRVSRTTISELESGKRKAVTIAELSVLAWALKVPPIQLIYPDLPDGPVEVVPGEEVPSIVAATWFSGETTFEPVLDPTGAEPADLDDLRAALEVSRGAQLVRLARERLELEERVRWLTGLIARLKSSDEPAAADQFVGEIVGAEARISGINKELRVLDGAVVANDGR